MGDVPVWEVDYGETKLYPDTETGVKQAKFRVPEYSSVDWCYFIHALNTAKRECVDTCYIILRVAGREYSLFGSLNGLPVAHMTQEGLVTFPDGHAPGLQRMTPGTMARLEAVIPEHPGGELSGPHPGGTLRCVEELPWLDGSLFKALNYKGQKKVCSWVSATLRGNRFGQAYLQKFSNDQGHGRGARYKTFTPVAGAFMDGDPTMTLEVSYGGSCTLGWAHVAYPSFSRAWELPVEGIIFCQEDDDKYNA